MPYYFFFRETGNAAPPLYEFVEQCEDHHEAAKKERAYAAASLERGEPVVRRVHAKTKTDARAIIERYGPKLRSPLE